MSGHKNPWETPQSPRDWRPAHRGVPRWVRVLLWIVIAVIIVLFLWEVGFFMRLTRRYGLVPAGTRPSRRPRVAYA